MGNCRGLHLAGWLGGLETTVAALETKVAELKMRNAAQDTRIASLEGQVEGLTASVEAHKSVRNRFIGAYRRGVLKNDTDADRRTIAVGNASAHWGDAVAGALLYKRGARSDFLVY